MRRLSKSQRRLVWNIQAENTGDPPVKHLTLIVVNEPREIKLIRNRLKENLEPTDMEHTILEGKIRGSGGIHYSMFSIDSYMKGNLGNIHSAIESSYDGMTIRDARLGTQKSPEARTAYVERMFS